MDTESGHKTQNVSRIVEWGEENPLLKTSPSQSVMMLTIFSFFLPKISSIRIIPLIQEGKKGMKFKTKKKTTFLHKVIG